MKMTFRTALISGFLFCSSAFAQTGVPSEMSYQAILTDENNALIAPTSSESYEVTVRIFAAATGGNPVWSERHVTDIFQGRLSITLGQGEAVPTAGGNTEPREDLANAFNQEDRFSEVTVRRNENEAIARTLAPRQKIVASATAFRARIAEGLTDNAVIGNGVISGSAITNGTIAGNKLANGTVTRDQIANSAITDTQIDGGINASKISSGGVSNTEFGHLDGVSSSIQTQLDSKASITRLDNALGAKADLANPRFTGRVGIGTSSPDDTLHVFGSSDPTIKIQSTGESEISGRLSLRQVNNTGFDMYYDGRNGAENEAFKVESFTGGTSNGVRMMIKQSSGRVGLNTTNPEKNLHVYGSDDPTIKIQSDGNDELSGRLSLRQSNGTGVDLYYDGSDELDHTAFECFAGGVSKGIAMVIKDNSDISGPQIGIGTTNPSKAKFEVEGAVNYDPPGLTPTRSFSIWASNQIGASGYVTISDARVKNIQGVSDGAADLDILNKIEVTDYTKKDVATHGNRQEKMVIAQQIESIYPQVVSQSRNEIPDIYQEAAVRDGWIELGTDLKKGDRIRLNHGSDEHGVYEVTEVEGKRFKTSFTPPEGMTKLFVFGREVGDFRTVDYDGIAMLNVSATQELARRLEAKEKEVATLTKRLEAMDAKMIAIERMLSSKTTPVTTASK